MRRAARMARQRGVGLIELLVGLTIGLLVIAAAIGTLIVSHGTAASIGDIARLQQQGSFALRVIGTQLRQAGSIEPTMDPNTGLYAFGTGSAVYGTTSAPINGSDGPGSGPDILSVANRASPGLAATQRRTCLGNAVKSGEKMQAQFRVDSNRQLVCDDGGRSGAHALIADVADFQVAYRIATSEGTRVMDATDVEASSQWGSVMAVEVCLDLVGEEFMTDAAGTYLACDGRKATRDGRVHLVFRNVFQVRTYRGRA